MLVLVILFVYPLWDVLVLSFSTPQNASKLGLRLFPIPVSLDAYGEMLKNKLIYIGYVNTLIRVVVGTLLTVSVTFCGAYALSKRGMPFRNPITLLILFTMFFNGGLIATFLNIRDLGLMDTRLALILPLTTSAWNLVLTRNFIASIPKELEESAFIDGAHPLKMIFYIMLPLSTPILAVLGLWTAVGHWNAWFDALIYINDPNKMVLQLLLRRLIIEESIEILNVERAGLFRVPLPQTLKAATIMITIGPIVLMYPFLQKYFVKGILVGSLKG